MSYCYVVLQYGILYDRKITELTSGIRAKRGNLLNKRGKHSMLATIGIPILLPSGTDHAFREFISDIFAASSMLQTLRRTLAERFDITAAELAVVLAISRSDVNPSIRQIAQSLRVSASNVTADVGRLERRGFVSKRRDMQDSRALNVALTPRGNALIERMTPALRKVNDRIFSAMTGQDMARMSLILRHIAKEGRRVVAEHEDQEN